MRRVLAFAPLALAFWPVGSWYVERGLDGSDEPLGPLALLVALVFLWRERGSAGALQGEHSSAGGSQGEHSSAARWRERASAPAGARPPGLELLPLALYALGYAHLPPLARAALAATSLALCASRVVLGLRFHAGLWALSMLALPVVASAQFFAGHPLRCASAAVAAALLRLGGLPVAREGAALAHGARLVWVDAPCSGVRMLWAGGLLAASLACAWRLSTLRTLALAGVALGAVLAANALRAAALFLLESELVRGPGWLHDGAGLFTFAAASAAIVAAARAGEEARCAPLARA